MIRGIVYKILRGALAAGAGMLTVTLAATPFGWLVVPVIGAVGKAIRVQMEKKDRHDLVKWVVI